MRLILLPTLMIATIATALTAGCDQDHSAPPAREPRTVLTTVYPIAAIVQQVGGERVKAQWLIDSGQSLAELESTEERRNSARVADLVITRGPSELWMLGDANNPISADRVIRIELLPAAQDALPDTCLWLDPQVARELSDEIARRLTSIEPAREKYFNDNAKEFQQEVDRIFEDGRAKIAALPKRQFLAPGNEFSAMAIRLGLQQALAGADPSQQTSPARIRDMSSIARGSKIRTVFVSQSLPPAAVRDLSEKLGINVLTLDPLGSSAPSGRNTYPKLLQYNIDQLIAGLRPTP